MSDEYQQTYHQEQWEESYQEQWQTEENWQEEGKPEDSQGQAKGNQPKGGNKRGESDFFFGLIIVFFKFIFEGIATSFELIIRKNFGERYFTPLKFLFGLVVVSVVAGAVISMDYDLSDVRYPQTGGLSRVSTDLPEGNLYQRPFTDEQLEKSRQTTYSGRVFYDLPNRPVFSAGFFAVYIALYILFGLSEFRKQFERNRDGRPWHSYNTGQSRVRFLDVLIKNVRLKSLLGRHLASNHINQLYIEPLFYFSLALVLAGFLPMVGGWLLIGSMVVFVRSQIIYGRVRKQIMDLKDSKIEAKFMAQAIKGADPSTIAGMSVMSIRPEFSSNGVSTEEAMSSVFANNPSLAKMAGIEPDKQEEDKSVRFEPIRSYQR